jgi:hypothetical protein
LGACAARRLSRQAKLQLSRAVARCVRMFAAMTGRLYSRCLYLNLSVVLPFFNKIHVK